jgi:hypothetical protein
MHGTPFLGSQTGEERQTVFAARDRVDESYDMIRSVRTKKYLYVRNYYPNEPFPIWVPYLSNMPIYKEMLRLDAEGKLSEDQKSWFAYTRPPEELYDVIADPYQLKNLVKEPSLLEILKDMRELHGEWTQKTGDLGHMNENEMIHMMWPAGVQPVTDVPYFIMNSKEDRSVKNYREGGTFTSPMTLGFYCPTQGSSIVYTFDQSSNPHWLLYKGPMHLKPGSYKIRVKAVRYGYKDSGELTGDFVIT